MPRIAVLDRDSCQPKLCSIECYRYCPGVKTGDETIVMEPETGKPVISEPLCSGCGICVPPQTEIMTLEGNKKIADVKVGDLALTHTGKFRKVSTVYKHKYVGSLYKIKVYGLPELLEVTENHPILAVSRRKIKNGRRLEKKIVRFQWLPPTQLKKGDYVALPIVKKSVRPRTVKRQVFVGVPNGKGAEMVGVDVKLPPERDLFRLIGYYLAEGSVDDRRLVFSFHEKEREYIEDVKTLIQKYFRVPPKERRGNGLGVNVRVDSALAARFFKTFGESCDTKSLSSEFLIAPTDMQKELILGLWRGDGCREKKRNYFSIITTSKKLSYQVKQILSRLGIVASIRKTTHIGKKTVFNISVFGDFVARMAEICGLEIDEKRNRTCSRFLITENSVYAPIQNIEIEKVSDTTVMNLEVEKDQSYVAAGVAVHNCVHKCPFGAISIINLPKELEGACVHRYGANGFALYGLPIPRAGAVVGLVGQNATGKTTVLNILSGMLVPNLGKEEPASKEDLNVLFRGSELQAYFGKIGKTRVAYKPQRIDVTEQIGGKTAADLLESADDRGVARELAGKLELTQVLDREVGLLSGGEVQRLAIAAASAKAAEVYFFDEPSSHLDVYQRLNVANVIRELAGIGKSVLIVEHDLALLDYICDQVHVVYGEPRRYGVVASPQGVRVGINVYLEGYLKAENVRFRKEPIGFEVRPPSKARESGSHLFSYPELSKDLNGFKLEVGGGEAYAGEVVGIVGANATGKTTFMRMLAGEIEPTDGKIDFKLAISYKPQYPRSDFDGLVEGWLRSEVGDFDPVFEPEVLDPLGVTSIMGREISNISGGELQRVAISACLGRQADIYLLDEPSAYLDVEQRLQMAKAIRRTIEKREAVAFVIDHDVLTVDLISDRLLVFGGVPGKKGLARGPFEMREGMNLFLGELGVTFRRDPQTGRPRANKPGSVLDREQRERGEYFYV